MRTEAVLVSTLLCCIIQVAHIPNVGADSTLLVQILVKTSNFGGMNYTWSQGPNECDDSSSTLQVNLTAPSIGTLLAKWVPVVSSCRIITDYNTSLHEVGGAMVNSGIFKGPYALFKGLRGGTVYQVRVQPLNSRGQAYGTPTIISQMTHTETPAYGCEYPDLRVLKSSVSVICAKMVTPGRGNNMEGNAGCNSTYRIPPNDAFLYFFYNEVYQPLYELQDYLRFHGRTEEFLVGAFYKNGGWMWGRNIPTAFLMPVNPDDLIGIPQGGEGPNDYTMLFLDPAKKFSLSPAKNGHVFGGMICLYIKRQ